MKKSKLKPRVKRTLAVKYTGNRNVAAAMAVNHRNQVIIVSRRYK